MTEFRIRLGSCSAHVSVGEMSYVPDGSRRGGQRAVVGGVRHAALS